MKRKFTLALVVLLIAAFTLAGCNGGSDNGDGDAASGETIKIGMIGPISGDNSMYGIAVRDGAMLAAEEINAAGGIDGQNIEIVALDSKADKTEAVNAYNKLVQQDGIVGLVGGTFSGETLAIKEIAVSDGTPILTPTATAADVTTDAPNVFRACYIDPYQGAAVAQFAMDNLEAKKAAIMYNIEDPYSEGLAEAFQSTFEDAGLEITSYNAYKAQDSDFSSILTNIKNEDPDVIFLPDYIAAVGKITAQIHDMGIDAVALGGDGWDGIEADYADQVEGYYFANHYSKSDDRDLVQNFITSYTDEFGSAPNALAALSYDSVKIMADAISRAGSTDPAAVVTALAETDMEGVAGRVTFDEQGSAYQKEISMIKIEDGKQVLIEKVSVK